MIWPFLIGVVVGAVGAVSLLGLYLLVTLAKVGGDEL
ncbi:hypothetical protein PBI_JEANIE_6 [Gordonia phage Jeanie]|uniref:Uncharacterized protein n=2 Tax=root TaxID=1 RepID=A0A160DJP1_9CAUD|nr:hypothetical protein BH764_gp06 [Gordonia phage McGonagall]ANA87584.1 hypothetical protein MCGONAGALL_6 [Gordonia phage McGonagall]ANA87611.1 hypothetical protein PBI_JEANIE_6 [Gordonia phage Jeanie]EGD53219.1 hypothetical protein SCNU_20067 [Gordonia neofelifaecis NRRL B-59395]